MQIPRKQYWLSSQLFAILPSYSFTAQAENSTFLKELFEQINKVIAGNSTSPNDPKAAFSLNEDAKTLTLLFERNKSLPGQDRDTFEMIATMLPQRLNSNCLHYVNGAVIGPQFINQPQEYGYKIIVIVKGTDRQFVFEYPSSILSLK